MLEVYFGNDSYKARQKAQLSVMNKLKEGQETIFVESDNYVVGTLLGLSNTSSLFGETEIYLVDVTDNQSDLYVEFIEQLESLATSQNNFICVAGGILAPEKKKIAKYTDILEEYKKEAEVKFNSFLMADALASKDKKSLWLLLQEAKRNNLSTEEIIGTLWWQLKALRLAALTKNAEEAGMKDFPYQKAKKALRNFKDGELEQKSRKLLSVYHEGHRGEVDLDLALEEWVLKV